MKKGSDKKGGGTMFFVMLIIIQSLLYGIGDPISKTAFETMSVYSLMTVRYSIAVLVLLCLCRSRVVKGLRGYPVRVWLVPSLCIAGGFVLNNVSINLTTATAATFLRSMSIILTPVLAFIFYRVRYRWVHLPLQGLVVVGLYLFCGGMSGFGPGEVVGLASAVLIAGSLVFSSTALEEMDALTLTTVQAATSALMALVCAFLFEGGLSLEGASPTNWAIILYLALACTLIGYLLQNKALAHISSRTVALLQCSAPVLTAVFSFFLLGETLTTTGFIGAAIILFCITCETLIDAREEAAGEDISQ